MCSVHIKMAGSGSPTGYQDICECAGQHEILRVCIDAPKGDFGSCCDIPIVTCYTASRQVSAAVAGPQATGCGKPCLLRWGCWVLGMNAIGARPESSNSAMRHRRSFEGSVGLARRCVEPVCGDVGGRGIPNRQHKGRYNGLGSRHSPPPPRSACSSGFGSKPRLRRCGKGLAC
jgi:hypothetical protein